MSSGMTQARSITTLLSRQPRPTSTSGSSTACEIVQNEWMRTPENSTESVTDDPETMQPPETMVLVVRPGLPSRPNTNLAGGSCRW
jgi:hypothetical protein